MGGCMSRDAVVEGHASESNSHEKKNPQLLASDPSPSQGATTAGETKSLYQQEDQQDQCHGQSAYGAETLGYEPDMTQNDLVRGL